MSLSLLQTNQDGFFSSSLIVFERGGLLDNSCQYRGFNKRKSKNLHDFFKSKRGSFNPSVGLSTYLACLRNDQFAQIRRSKTKRKTFPLLTLNGVKQETIRRQL